MLDTFLIPEKSVIREKGDGAPLDISATAGKVLLLTLTITRIVEQQSLDLSIWGSPDGNDWGQKPLASFPQKFYAGQHPLLLDLTAEPNLRFLRAHWEVNRWGRSPEPPLFELQLSIREVPQEMVDELRTSIPG